LLRITYPSGLEVDFGLDGAGRIMDIASTRGAQRNLLVSNVSYEPFGPVSSFQYGNGSSYAAVYDHAWELDRLQSGPAMDWLINSDQAGNILGISDQLDGLFDRVYGYDALNRLNAEAAAGREESFDYDANGNRTLHSGGVFTDTLVYEPGSNRIAARSGWGFARDSVGNRIAKLDANGHGLVYLYGDHSRLKQLLLRDEAGDRALAEYQYDGRGQRVQKSVDGESIDFIYGLGGELIGEYPAGANGDHVEYVWLSGMPVAVVTRQTEIIQPPGAELILDTGEAGTSSKGSWRSRSSREAYGGEFLLANKAAGQSYRWEAAPPGENYQVYAWWVDKGNQSNDVRYTIGYGSGKTARVTKSHRTGGGSWQLLGSFDRGEGDYVEVDSSENKFVADAVRWLEVTEPRSIVTETTGFIHFDHQGTPRTVSDESQRIIWAWSSDAFGRLGPDQDPDGDSREFTLNLRFPGQYYDEESGLHYNYFRNYDPEIGRYIESDPVGLEGGSNVFGYALQNPLSFIDPMGLAVTGEWIEPPRFNLSSYGVDRFELVRGSGSPWGYIEFIRLFGYAAGYVNVDVQCMNSESCDETNWEIHDRVNVFYQGSADIGPNAYAAIAGRALGPYGWMVANILTAGGSALTGGLEFLKGAEQKAGLEIALLYTLGPDAICLAGGKQ
jgi:RHS repeat-associated protein